MRRPSWQASLAHSPANDPAGSVHPGTPESRTSSAAPDQVGMVVMHLAGPQDDPRWARDYGPWTGLGILVLWTALTLVGGLLVLRRRDA
ncbi:hypothetical protein GCM10023193_09400 [Planotetraspora kaengkrachanensis]|uniref:Uncharacterized protein n=1 Tax=Planotetraspora kaengkrachanensis TaxID=575193 RepID=A0A8J3PQP0_9ACTN|nr:hypothetical protein Pka01_07410 [Planotetraspora kaengkrachanensis]